MLRAARVAPEKAVFRPALPMRSWPGMSEMHMASSYREKLLDPRWQKKRLEILTRDNFTCQHCASTEKTLHVHHHGYWQNLDPWEYPDAALVTLCAECHDTEGLDSREAARDLLAELRRRGADASALWAVSVPLQLMQGDQRALTRAEWSAIGSVIRTLVLRASEGADIEVLADLILRESGR